MVDVKSEDHKNFCCSFTASHSFRFEGKRISYRVCVPKRKRERKEFLFFSCCCEKNHFVRCCWDSADQTSSRWDTVGGD